MAKVVWETMAVATPTLHRAHMHVVPVTLHHTLTETILRWSRQGGAVWVKMVAVSVPSQHHHDPRSTGTRQTLLRYTSSGVSSTWSVLSSCAPSGAMLMHHPRAP